MEQLIFLDYATLRVVWWALLGLLFIGFAVMDGFDLGAAAILPYVARRDVERKAVLQAIEPVWEGNQVWLVLGAGAVFAAWPALYAAAFTIFYPALFLVLVALILRPVGFNFRNKLKHPAWRSAWDWVLVGGGIVPAFGFGVVVGNLFVGVPFRFDAELRLIYEGSFLDLLNPFAILCGFLGLAMMVMHGAVYLCGKTQGAIKERASGAAAVGGFAVVALFAAAALWVTYGIEGYVITAGDPPGAPSNPLGKTVERLREGWLGNFVGTGWEYHKQRYIAGFGGHGWEPLVPILGFMCALAAPQVARYGRGVAGFVISALSLAGMIGTAGIALFPFLLPSSSHLESSLTVWDASSSRMTLFIMLAATVVFLPLVIAYTGYVFRVLRGPVTLQQAAEHEEKY